MIYARIIRPILFRIDPETIHNLVLLLLKIVSRISFLRWFIGKICNSSSDLSVKVGRINFPNPIGLAAGFDKNIVAPLAYRMLGFGFVEFGSITYEPQDGNSKPRLWRLPKDKSLIVNFGLSNLGAKEAAKKLAKIPELAHPFGISIAPSNSVSIDDMADDYIKTFLLLYKFADYITFNVSCPNVSRHDCFAQVSFIAKLLDKIQQTCLHHGIDKDLYLKIGPDLSKDEIDKIVDLCLKFKITGLVISNLVKNRDNLKGLNSSVSDLSHTGGISGRPIKELGDSIIKQVRSRAGNRLVIMGLGGVFSFDDYSDKIRAGATVVQMMTGWIYGGPLSIKKILLRINSKLS